ncbi:MAG: putative DNA binding domain-containing protein [Methanomassiliicoccaceae archaeon]|nr:putative DNA binding domain-containing protein [Methanomassiliicoccaceae archaeon]
MQLTETDNTEYKRKVTDNIEKSVVSFLNASGGEIHIGIDPNGTVYGVDDYDEEIRKFNDRVRTNITPSALGLFTVTPKMGSNGKVYFVVKIASGFEKPYYINEFGMSPKGCFIRTGTQSSPMTQTMIDTLYTKRSLHTLKNTVSPRQKLTFTQLKIYYDGMGFSTENENFLENLDLYTDDGKFNYLAYLMADNNAVSVKIARYADTDKVVILQKTECGECSLLKATYTMLAALDMYNETAVEITYPKRIETRLVDKLALREAAINAIVHNDYIKGAYPVVEFYSDRVEVTSSGGLPTGLEKEEFFRGRSHPRNREIMRIFKDMDLCEQLGSGMKRIMKVYSPEDFEISTNFVVASFKYDEHALKVMSGSEKVTEKYGKSSGKVREKFVTMSATKKRMLEMISEDNTITTDAMARAIGLTVRAVEKNIKQLRDAGILERRNGGRSGYWMIIEQ